MQSISNIGGIFNIRYSFTPAPDARAAHYIHTTFAAPRTAERQTTFGFDRSETFF